jgi:hypothetical protein
VTLPWWPATRRWALRWELVNDVHNFGPLASKVLSFSSDFLAMVRIQQEGHVRIRSHSRATRQGISKGVKRHGNSTKNQLNNL